MDSKHNHIYSDWYNDQAQSSCTEMSQENGLTFMSFQLNLTLISLLTKGTCVSPQISHKFLIVDTPTVAIVNRPTHLQLTVKPRPRPVRASQKYHQNWKGLCAENDSVNELNADDVNSFLYTCAAGYEN